MHAIQMGMALTMVCLMARGHNVPEQEAMMVEQSIVRAFGAVESTAGHGSAATSATTAAVSNALVVVAIGATRTVPSSGQALGPRRTRIQRKSTLAALGLLRTTENVLDHSETSMMDHCTPCAQIIARICTLSFIFQVRTGSLASRPGGATFGAEGNNKTLDQASADLQVSALREMP